MQPYIIHSYNLDHISKYALLQYTQYKKNTNTDLIFSCDTILAPSLQILEYTNCIPPIKKRKKENQYHMYDTQHHLMVRLQFRNSEEYGVTHSQPWLPDPLWSRVEVSVRFTSMG